MLVGIFGSRSLYGRELMIIGTVLLTIVCMPMIALASVSNVVEVGPGNATLYIGTDDSGNLYAPGNCTFWVSKRRTDVNLSIPQRLGDARSWDNNMQSLGYTVSDTPSQYAIMQTDAGQYGHVAFVEGVREDGSIDISEMNVLGLNIVSTRRLSPVQIRKYRFIW